MKTLCFAVATLLAAFATAHVQAQDGVVDLTALPNYANQARPAYITKNNTPANNAITDAGATLGRVLFYDKRLSRNNTISCSSCHQQASAFSDGAIASSGVAGTTGRHSMRLINARFGADPRFFWDERATTLENQSTQPIRDHVEMGFSGGSGDPAFADLIAKLSAVGDYRVLFTMAFGTSAIEETRIQRALAQFVRSIQSFDSKYDAGRAQVVNDATNFPNFTANENAGKQLFLRAPNNGGAGCNACHRAPEFDIDPGSDNNGVIGTISGIGTDLTNERSPTLRDLVAPGGQTNGPFMHNGVFTTLLAVVNHYNVIPALNVNLDPRLRPGGQPQNLGLTQQEKNDLIAFMGTLTGSAVYTDAKWADPFTTGGEVSVSALSRAGTAIARNPDGTATISCKAAPGFQYELQSSADLRTWTSLETLTTDTENRLTKVVSMAAPSFYRFALVVPES
jgi:cytochrome c peroxidase